MTLNYLHKNTNEKWDSKDFFQTFTIYKIFEINFLNKLNKIAT